MKKILFILSTIFLCSCCDCKVEQTYFIISEIKSVTKDSTHNFCKYYLHNRDMTITDAIGKFKIGDTVVFEKRIRTLIDTNTIK